MTVRYAFHNRYIPIVKLNPRWRYLILGHLNTDEYEWVPCMRDLLGSHCAILVLVRVTVLDVARRNRINGLD